MVLPVASTQLKRAPAAPDGGLLARSSLLFVRAMCTGQEAGMRMRGALVAVLQQQGAPLVWGFWQGGQAGQDSMLCCWLVLVCRVWEPGWRLCCRSGVRDV